MRSYSTYAVAVTVRIVLTFFTLTVGWDFYFPTILIILLAGIKNYIIIFNFLKSYKWWYYDDNFKR